MRTVLLLLDILGCTDKLGTTDSGDSVFHTGDTNPDSVPDDTSSNATYYQDADDDGYGNPEESTQAATRPAGYVANSDDCDDTNADVHPGATEECGDGLDNDCDGGNAECRSEGGDLSDQDSRFFGSAGRRFAAAISGPGDIDGDGYDDLVFSSSETGYTLVVPGSANLENMQDPTRATYLSGDADALSGFAVSTVGDIDGDGYDDVLVGAPADSTKKDFGGSAVLVLGPTDTGIVDLTAVTQTQIWGTQDYRLLGTAAQPVADFDDDGSPALFIGAAGYGSSGASDTSIPGAVLGFTALQMDSDKWNDTDAGTTFIGEGSDTLGTAVSTGQDADGTSVLVLGAPYSNDVATSAGRVLLFVDATAGTYAADDAAVVLTSAQAGAEFGSSVSANGDMDGDGYEDLWVGAPHDDASDAGAAYLFLGPLSDLSDGTTGSASAVVYGAEDQELGTALSVGPYDADAYSDFLVGAPGDSLNTGAAFLWYGPLAGSYSSASADAPFSGESRGDLVGEVLNYVGDVNHDGAGDAVVAAPGDDTEGTDGGVVYLLPGVGF